MRRLFVHMYWKVDDNTLYEMIQINLNDLHQFSKIIAPLFPLLKNPVLAIFPESESLKFLHCLRY